MPINFQTWDKSKHYDVTYISLGAGVQSSAMYMMSVLGEHGVPRADVAIFADTMDEGRDTYEFLEVIEEWGRQQENPIPIHKVSEGHLSADVIARHRGEKKRCAAIPAFVVGEDGKPAPMRRHCTAEYKVRPIQKFVRRNVMGLKHGERIGKKHALCMLGISNDELGRMKDNPEKWASNGYPLVDAGLNRDDCRSYVEQKGLPTPPRSACVFCPFHSTDVWKEMRDDSPDDFEKACVIDEAIRDMSASGVRQEAFLHRSLRPLRDEPFDDGQMDLFWDECEGHCGI